MVYTYNLRISISSIVRKQVMVEEWDVDLVRRNTDSIVKIVVSEGIGFTLQKFVQFEIIKTKIWVL
jgi:hypothetical protein